MDHIFIKKKSKLVLDVIEKIEIFYINFCKTYVKFFPRFSLKIYSISI